MEYFNAVIHHMKRIAGFDADCEAETPALDVLSDAAYRLWVRAVVHCQQLQTGGQILPWRLVTFHVQGSVESAVRELLQAGLWGGALEGYAIVAFETWEYPGALVAQIRRRARDRQARRRASRDTSRDMSRDSTGDLLSVVPVRTVQVQEDVRTAALPRRASHMAKATLWRRAIAIAHLAIEAEPTDTASQTEIFKSICGAQGLPYGARDTKGRPLYASALEYVRVLREKRRAG
jgi:hypothetical protein